MNPIVFALNRPYTVMVVILGLVLGSMLAVLRMPIDIFPNLNLPVIYVIQAYGGMDPAQMEGLLTNYYEYHFLCVSGIHHVESRNIQGAALMKLFFHPGTNMAQAMAETIAYVNRSRSFMPPGTVPPDEVRFDAGSVPVGYLVLSSEKRSIGEMQDLALFRVRPMFASLPGVSAPPPFGGNQRTLIVKVDPERLRSYNLSPDDVVAALKAGNSISPSGTARIKDQMPIVPVNSMVRALSDLGSIPLRLGEYVYLRNVAAIEDSTDIPSGHTLVNGKPAIFMLVTKRADASTLSVVNEVKDALPRMKAVLPEDIDLRFEFDQSPYVTQSIFGVAQEGVLGAFLTGLMVLLFLRDWRSAVVVVLNIPFALLAALFALMWMRGPEEAVLRIALRKDNDLELSRFQERLREDLPRRLGEWFRQRLRKEGLGETQTAQRLRGMRFSFEPADVVNQIMSFGSPTPIEITVSGPEFDDNRAYAQKLFAELSKVPSLRDLQYGQSLDYPAVAVQIDREKAGLSGVTAADVARSLVSATSSSRFVEPIFWADPKTGIGYYTQVEIPPYQMNSPAEIGMVPLQGKSDEGLLVRDVAQIREGTVPGEYDRYNMRRLVSITANIEGEDLGRVIRRVEQARRDAGEPPRGVEVDIRGQAVPMEQMFRGLAIGLALAMVVIVLLLSAYYQSLRLALISASALPAVLAGVAIVLVLTGTTLNIQSFMGTIMSIGVATANAILLLTFAERSRREGVTAQAAAVEGAQGRLRPILMTSFAMLAGMVPMALALGEGGEQTAPLGQAVIGGLGAATAATLLVLPSVFALF